MSPNTHRGNVEHWSSCSFSNFASWTVGLELALIRAMSKETTSHLPKAFANNLSQLIAHDKERDDENSVQAKLINRAIGVFGSSGFLWLNILAFVAWIVFNTGNFSFAKPFDPYPFEFLTMSVSLEAIVLSIVVLIAQNKLQVDSDERAQLDLHINLLAESETTLILRKLQRIEEKLGITIDAEEAQRVGDLIEDTHPENLAKFIHETFRAPATKR